MRLTTACFLSWNLWAGGLASGQVPGSDPLQPNPIPVSIPTLPDLPPPVAVPAPPPVAVPTPVVDPTTTPNPIGNPIGNPIAAPVGNPIGNPLQTPDVTAGGRPNPGENPAQGQQPSLPGFRVYVGTYTNARSQGEGIYQFTFDPNAGTLTDRTLAAKASNPSFVAIHPSRKFLYAVSEVGNFDGKPAGSLSSYTIDPKSGALALLNTESSGGADPCFVAVDATGGFALVANYSGGSVEALPIQSDGKLGPATGLIQHKGSSVNQGRQQAPHAHSVNMDPTNRLAIVADLGLDRLMIYHLDPQTGALRPNIPPSATLAPGAGPRHLAFHPDGRHAYVINELANTITVFDFDSSRGSFAALETVHTRPDPKKPNSYTAEVVVHPSGRFVYGSNRGDDTLAIFSVAPASGKLIHVGFQPTGGKNPRNFAIDPTGQFLLCGNQDSNTITIFRIDRATGRLAPVGEPVPCPAPVCIRFTPLGSPDP